MVMVYIAAAAVLGHDLMVQERYNNTYLQSLRVSHRYCISVALYPAGQKVMWYNCTSGCMNLLST